MFEFTLEGQKQSGKGFKRVVIRCKPVRARDRYEAMDKVKAKLGPRYERLIYPIFRTRRQPAKHRSSINVAVLDLGRDE